MSVASMVLRSVVTDHARVAWEPFREGIEIHRLYDAGPSGTASALLRYRPGARLPAHEHTGVEHIVILSGSQVDERGVYGPGTLVINAPGSRHSVHAPDGCTVLVVWERSVQFFGDRP
jgi:anti-sigma factor ChrR (cupin superfamily)